MALFVLHKLIFQTHMRSHPVGLDVWCVRTAKVLVRLCGCIGSPNPSLVAYVISSHNLMSWLISAPTSRGVSDSSTIRRSNFCDGSRIIGPRRTAHLYLQIIVMVNLLYSSYLTKGLKEQMSCLMTKPTKRHVRPAKTQISLGTRPVWSEPSLCAQWVAKDPTFLHVDSEDSDQTEQMPRLIWVFAGHTCHFAGFVMSRLK